jgi:hypothetical protein
MSSSERLSQRALGRALLARQGLLERMRPPLADVLEAIGAMQGQAYSALPVGLHARVEDFALDDLYSALERGELCWGIGIRGTLHLVSAREHPAYAVVAGAGVTEEWHRKIERTTPAMRQLRAALLDFAATQPRTNEEIRAFADRWVDEHPQAIDAREVHAQRELKWRPIYRWSALLRAPATGGWGAKAPADHLAAPHPPGSARSPTAVQALAQLVRCHLRAFGPAAAEDVACWVGVRTPAVRQVLEGMVRGDTEGMARGDTESTAREGMARGDTESMAREGMARGDTESMAREGMARGDTESMAREGMARGDTKGTAREGMARGDTGAHDADALLTFSDEHDRILYDLPQAPRPDPDTPAPPRLLGAFDSMLLAYAVKHRGRILPEQLRDLVYQKANLQIRPTFLLDGRVAGTWSLEVRRGEALLTLSPAGKLDRAARTALDAEATSLLQALHPGAKGWRVTLQ